MNTHAPFGNFDALTDPWIPVTTLNGLRIEVSLGDALTKGHEYRDLDRSAMTPVELEAILRFLISAAAAVTPHGTAVDTHDLTLPTNSADLLRDTGGIFTLNHPERPFLQEWGLIDADTHNDLTTGASLLPLRGMDIHVPGASSANWGLRATLTHDTDITPAVLTRLLVVTWQHTNFSNAAAPTLLYPNKRLNGAPMGGAKTTAHFYLHGATLTETLLVNIPHQWVDGSSPMLPAWLDQELQLETPAQAAAMGSGVWGYSWAPNRPRILWDDDNNPLGYVNGLTRTATQLIPAPHGVNKEWKDTYKAWFESVRATDPTLPPDKTTNRIPADITHSRGVLTWYRNNLDTWIADWGNDRIGDKHDDLSVLIVREIPRDSYGTLDAATANTAPLFNLHIPFTARAYMNDLVTLADKLVWLIGKDLKAVSKLDSKSVSPLRGRAETDFYTRIDDVIFTALTAYRNIPTDPDDGDAAIVDAHNMARRSLVDAAIATFTTATIPLETPATAATVEHHRGVFAATARKQLTPPKTRAKKGAPTP